MISTSVTASQLSSVFLSLVLEDHFLLFYVSSTIFSTHPDSVAFQCAGIVVVCRVSWPLCWLTAGRRANISAASQAGRPNQTLEAGLIGLTYSIKPSIKPPLTIHWGLTASDIKERARTGLFKQS